MVHKLAKTVFGTLDKFGTTDKFKQNQTEP